MGYILREYECTKCAHVFEDLVERKVSHESVCPECSATAVSVLSVPKLGKYSMADAQGRKDILRVRSERHTAKLRKNDG